MSGTMIKVKPCWYVNKRLIVIDKLFAIKCCRWLGVFLLVSQLEPGGQWAQGCTYPPVCVSSCSGVSEHDDGTKILHSEFCTGKKMSNFLSLPNVISWVTIKQMEVMKSKMVNTARLQEHWSFLSWSCLVNKDNVQQFVFADEDLCFSFELMSSPSLK